MTDTAVTDTAVASAAVTGTAAETPVAESAAVESALPSGGERPGSAERWRVCALALLTGLLGAFLIPALFPGEDIGAFYAPLDRDLRVLLLSALVALVGAGVVYLLASRMRPHRLSTPPAAASLGVLGAVSVVALDALFGVVLDENDRTSEAVELALSVGAQTAFVALVGGGVLALVAPRLGRRDELVSAGAIGVSLVMVLSCIAGLAGVHLIQPRLVKITPDRELQEAAVRSVRELQPVTVYVEDRLLARAIPNSVVQIFAPGSPSSDQLARARARGGESTLYRLAPGILPDPLAPRPGTVVAGRVSGEYESPEAISGIPRGIAVSTALEYLALVSETPEREESARGVVLRSRVSRERLADAAAAFPGDVYLLGDEADLAPDSDASPRWRREIGERYAQSAAIQGLDQVRWVAQLDAEGYPRVLRLQEEGSAEITTFVFGDPGEVVRPVSYGKRVSSAFPREAEALRP